MNRDYLTGLYNMMYLRNNYETYIKKNKEAKIIAIDFAKLKYINDNFGHSIGDKCLKLFASFTNIIFPGSILVRRSGDEFIIVTNSSNKELEEKMNEVNKLITREAKIKNIPIVFDFNCGVKDCDEDLDRCLKDADLVMYCAKQNGERIMHFDESIIEKHEKDSAFIEKVQNIYNNSDYKFVYQSITDGNEDLIKEIYARDPEGNSIFEGKLYNLLMVHHFFKIIDFKNINYLLRMNRDFFNDKVMINVRYYSLLSKDYAFTEFLSSVIKKNKINPSNIILSINIFKVDNNISELISVLDELNKLGVSICIDNCNYNTLSYVMIIVRNIKVKYVKIGKEIWKTDKENDFDDLALKSIVNFFLNVKVMPIFKRIETKEEYNALKDYKGSLYSGRYFHKEQELEKN